MVFQLNEELVFPDPRASPGNRRGYAASSILRGRPCGFRFGPAPAGVLVFSFFFLALHRKSFAIHENRAILQ